MKKVLVLGIGGMLGNCVYDYLKSNNKIHVVGTARNANENVISFVIENENYINELNNILLNGQFDYIINCIGYIRPNGENINEYKKSLLLNSHLPKSLGLFSNIYNYKLIHISTDCVYNGKIGEYSANSIPDEFGIYGLSKFLGEVYDDKNLTIRTSIIGIERNNSKNLLNWFLSNDKNAKIYGYSNVFWNGVTTLTVSKIIEKIIIEDIEIKGLIQIGSNPISKFKLLLLFNRIFGKEFSINKNEEVFSNKVIIPSNEQILFQNLIPDLETQISELKNFYNL